MVSPISNSNIPDSNAVSAADAVAASDAAHLQQLTGLIQTFNQDAMFQFTVLAPHTENVSPDVKNQALTLVGTLYSTVNSMTPQQLLQIPGFLPSFQKLVANYDAGLGHATKIYNDTGAVDFSVPPLSSMFRGDMVSGEHYQFYSQVSDVLNLMGINDVPPIAKWPNG